jgi:dTMP kinase
MNTESNRAGPFFIVLCGVPGAGKTTQLQALKQHFGEAVVVSNDIPATSFLEEIWELLLQSPRLKSTDARTLFPLLWASWNDHLHRKVKPALASGRSVFCESFDSSIFAYFVFGQMNQSFKDLFWLERQQYYREICPDHYFFLETEPTVGLRRKQTSAERVLPLPLSETDYAYRVQSGLKLFLPQVPHTVIAESTVPELVTVAIVNRLREIGFKV